ncbi:unnamed protein product [Prunus armeniaca]
MSIVFVHGEFEISFSYGTLFYKTFIFMASYSYSTVEDEKKIDQVKKCLRRLGRKHVGSNM